ncbi:UNVERIFIED_CONTAM: hypothetical protein FKN15_058910 [Acipenser sinensis]
MLSHAFLLQHILSTRHKDFVSNSRNNVSANSLMERFLQDVIQHHPYRYNDSRPTHADLPSLNLPLVPKEELSDVYCLPEDAVHLAQASFQLEAFGSRFTLDLSLNKLYISPKQVFS